MDYKSLLNLSNFNITIEPVAGTEELCIGWRYHLNDDTYGACVNSSKDAIARSLNVILLQACMTIEELWKY